MPWDVPSALEAGFLGVQKTKPTVWRFRVWARLLFRGGDRVGGYLQHTHAHGQAIQQQKLLQGRQAVLAERTITIKRGRARGICQTGQVRLQAEKTLILPLFLTCGWDRGSFALSLCTFRFPNPPATPVASVATCGLLRW